MARFTLPLQSWRRWVYLLFVDNWRDSSFPFPHETLLIITPFGEHSTATDVAWYQFSVLVLYVGWICYWFSLSLQDIFSGTTVFPLFKTNISK